MKKNIEDVLLARAKMKELTTKRKESRTHTPSSFVNNPLHSNYYRPFRVYDKKFTSTGDLFTSTVIRSVYQFKKALAARCTQNKDILAYIMLLPDEWEWDDAEVDFDLVDTKMDISKDIITMIYRQLKYEFLAAGMIFNQDETTEIVTLKMKTLKDYLNDNFIQRLSLSESYIYSVRTDLVKAIGFSEYVIKASLNIDFSDWEIISEQELEG